MVRVAALVFLSMLSIRAFSQVPNLDSLMERRFLTCTDITYNSMRLVREYHEKMNDDSVRIVLAYWADRCGETVDIKRTGILVDIIQGDFSQDKYTALLSALLGHKEVADHSQYYEHRYNPDFVRWSEVANEFKNFSIALAEEARLSSEPGSVEYLVSRFFENDFEPLLSALRAGELAPGKLQQEFNEAKAKLDNMTEGHLAMLGEFWAPTGPARILGNHPGLGFVYGMRKNRFLLDLTMVVRFMKAKEPYSIFEYDSLFTTDHFQSFYMGGEVGEVIARNAKNELAVLGGIGYDAITSIPEDEEEGIKSVSTSTLNLNFGLGYRRFYGKEGRYFGFQARYNVVDYFTRGGTDLSGNTLSFRLLWGMCRNMMRDHDLRLMGY